MNQPPNNQILPPSPFNLQPLHPQEAASLQASKKDPEDYVAIEGLAVGVGIGIDPTGAFIITGQVRIERHHLLLPRTDLLPNQAAMAQALSQAVGMVGPPLLRLLVLRSLVRALSMPDGLLAAALGKPVDASTGIAAVEEKEPTLTQETVVPSNPNREEVVLGGDPPGDADYGTPPDEG